MNRFAFISKINKRILLLISFLVIFAFSVLALVLSSSNKPATRNYTNNTQYSFDQYSNELFSSQLSGDWLSLHFYLEHPEEWDLDTSTPTLGEYNYQSMQESQNYYINQINYLKSLNYKELYPSQQ